MFRFSNHFLRYWLTTAGLVLSLMLGACLVAPSDQTRTKTTGDQETMQTAVKQETVASTIPFSFEATVVDPYYDGDTVLVEVSGRDEPLQVEVSDTSLVGPRGATFPTGCAGLYRNVTITAGTWRTSGRHLKARQIRVHDLTPSVTLSSDITRAPADTLAYFIKEHGRPGANRSYTMVALREEGVARELMTTTLKPVPRLQGYGTEPTFLFMFSVPDCDQAWFFGYTLERGNTDRWLTAPEWSIGAGMAAMSQAGMTRFVKRSEQGDLLLFTRPMTKTASGWRSDGAWHYGSLPLQSPHSLIVDAIGTVDRRLLPRGWRAATNQIVTLVPAPDRSHFFDVVELRLLDLVSGNVAETFPFPPEDVSQTSVVSTVVSDVDGSHLFYDVNTPPATAAIHVFNLENGKDTILLQNDQQVPLLIRGVSSERLFIVKKIPDETGQFTRKQLLAVELTHPREPILITEITGTESNFGATVLSCSERRVLYTVERRETTQIQLWHPNGTTRAILQIQDSGALWLQACR